MRSVLVTGGTGSFGKAFTRRLLHSHTERICILSRDEYKQHLMAEEFGHNTRLRFFVGDVRDRERLRRAMEGVDTAIHAAALKRIETGFYNPSELVKTNVLGTMNVIEAATDAGVQKCVLLSTDKAFEPVSAYGFTKATAESLFLASNNTRGAKGPRFAVTRYGNVAGSNGSVIPTWRRILKMTDAVPVTDPDCTRFWMTMDQAVDLVYGLAESMRGGELKVPDLPAFRLGDLAEAMGAKMQVSGLGMYEKKHETMQRGFSSDLARRMSVGELRDALQHV